MKGEKMTCVPSNEPTHTIVPYQSDKDFIFLCILEKNGQKPTVLFKIGDCEVGHGFNLIDLTPLFFCIWLRWT